MSRKIVNKSNKADLQIIANTRKLTKEYYLSDYDDIKNRQRILSELLGKIGENVVIDTPFHCNYGKNIFIGNNVIININCTFIDDSEIIIGNNVLIASNVQIYTASHIPEPNERIINDWREKGVNWFSTYSEPIVIKDGVWIGGGAIILPNVTIGKNSVIGAGSLVNRSIPDNCVAVGNPCRPIRFFNQ
jgi:maltose O-acetyltransferase